MDPRAGVDDVDKRKSVNLPGYELRPLGRPARSQSLYRLRYPGSWIGGWVVPRIDLDDLENSEPSVVQPVASCYTDCAIQVFSSTTVFSWSETVNLRITQHRNSRHEGSYEYCYLIGCDGVLHGRMLQTFQRSLMSPTSSMKKFSSTMKKGAAISFETLVDLLHYKAAMKYLNLDLGRARGTEKTVQWIIICTL
jgi:hypothetical protein